MLDILLQEISPLSAAEGLQKAALRFPQKALFTTSFSLEDQAITHFIFSQELDIRVIMLDTGRLFEESQKVFSQTIQRYSKRIEVFFPDPEQVEKMVSLKGPFSFYESVENRKECCHIRKVLPLQRALAGMDLWITGIRREHSPGRDQMEKLEWDEKNKVFKYHPLLDWTQQEVQDFIRKEGIPYNVLHDRGYPSIGCAPCTRAVKEGEDMRAGRWWWEQNSGKECGLHK